MNKFDTVLFDRVFDDCEGLIGEKLVLKKKLTGDDEYVFVVTSDNPDVTKGNNETFVKRELIKNSGMFYFDKGNIRRWVSKQKFKGNEFTQQVPRFRDAINAINGLEDIIDKAEDIEEYGESGFSDRITAFIDQLKIK